MVEPWDFFAPRVSITVGDVAVSAPAADNTAGNVVKGDANSDGKVSVSDAVTVLQYISNQKKYPMTEAEIELADIDGENGIIGGDAIAIQKMDAGII